MDTLLFFKQGKFYECFHMDSDVMVKELGLLYMRGELAHAGFPEISFGYFSEKLVALGYRVARVEQVETPQQLKDRNAAMPKGQKKDAVVLRSLCGIKSKGTRTYSYLDQSAGATAEAEAASSKMDAAAVENSLIEANGGSYLYSLKERSIDALLGLASSTSSSSTSPATPSAGAAAAAVAGRSAGEHHGIVHIAATVVDAATGSVILAEFVDDRYRSRLRTLMARLPPAEFVYERALQAAGASGGSTNTSPASVSSTSGTSPSATTGLSPYTRRMLRYDAPTAVHTVLLPNEEYWNAQQTAWELLLGPFPSASLAASAAGSASTISKPSTIPSQSGAIITARGNLPGSTTQSRLRQCDYFVEDQEAASASSSSSSSSSQLVTPSNVVTLQGPDGKARHFPVVLMECLKKAIDGGFQPALPDNLSELLSISASSSSSSSLSAKATGGADVPLSALALSAFGGIVSYLRRCLIDHPILSLRKVARYQHADGSLLVVGDGSTTEGGGISAAALDGSGSGAMAVDEEPAASSSSSSSSFVPSKPTRGVPRGEGDGGVPHMVLDGTTLINLEILANSYDGSLTGTLAGVFDRYVTSPFGRRRLRQWLCTPLYRKEDIEDRLLAVEQLMPLLNGPVKTAQAALKGIPDLERLLARIHTLGSKVLSVDHPDSAAVMYENETYSKRKIADLLQALKAFKAIASVRKAFHDAEGDSDASSTLGFGLDAPMLKRVLDTDFPDLQPLLTFFGTAFDAKQAEKEGKIRPAPGVDTAFDGAIRDIKQCDAQLAAYLDEQKQLLKCNALTYWGNGKDRFQIEVPENIASRVPASYSLKSKRKGSGKTQGVHRYWTPEIERLLAEMTGAEERREAATKDSLRRIFHRFDTHRLEWQSAVNSVAILDCLFALANYSSVGDGQGSMVKPEFVATAPSRCMGSSRRGGNASADDSSVAKPSLHIEEGRHPCMVLSSLAVASSSSSSAGGLDGSASAGASSVIPNSISLGSKVDDASMALDAAGEGEGEGFEDDPVKAKQAKKEPTCILLTGPNMGGKSSLLRQSCLSVILAQLGCFVPASRMVLSPVDRIFTRVGASDRILAGQSTFYVELAETSTILNQSTANSLVILDELGRGTSTFDGNAIAYAVTKHLVDVVGCRTLFATHYHGLTEDFEDDSDVALGHMGCIVEGDDKHTDVTFLYRYTHGSLPLSYGMNVARLAHLPESVIARAKAKSEEFERAVEAAKKGELVVVSPAGASASSPTASASASAEDSQWLAFYESLEAFAKGHGDAPADVAAYRQLVETAKKLKTA
jgi:DNA mismatch repair ATPase MutS